MLAEKDWRGSLIGGNANELFWVSQWPRDFAAGLSYLPEHVVSRSPMCLM